MIARPLFNALGDAFVKKVVDKLVHSSEVHMVFDRYDVEDSVKTKQRMRRTGNGVVGPGYQIMGTRQIPIWKEISKSHAKQGGIDRLLVESHSRQCQLGKWKQSVRCRWLQGYYQSSMRHSKQSDRCRCFELQAGRGGYKAISSSVLIFDQRCSQDQVRGRAIIKSPDTDVVVLAIHYFSKCTAVDEVWLEIGGASQDVDHHRFLPIHDMYKSLR